IRWRRSWPRNIHDRVNTTRNTSPVIASTSLLFSLMGQSLEPVIDFPAAGNRYLYQLLMQTVLHYRSLFQCLAGGRATVFLQLVVQRFQADAQDLGSPRLVVARRLQGLQDQHPLGFIHGAANFYVNTTVAVVIGAHLS